jgi:hypothetical protein
MYQTFPFQGPQKFTQIRIFGFVWQACFHLEEVAGGREDALVNGKASFADDDLDVAKLIRLTKVVEAGQDLGPTL